MMWSCPERVTLRSAHHAAGNLLKDESTIVRSSPDDMTSEQISLLISVMGLLLALHVGVGAVLAFVIGALFSAAIQERDS
jgi:hypothetical protein